MEKLAPICLFTYNRLEETKQTVEALKNNFLASQSELFIFSDGAKNKGLDEKIEKVRTYLKTIKGFKNIKIIESNDNKGLANSIISGVTQIFNEYNKVIVLEDDLITTPNFLDFMNKGLDYFSSDDSIYSVNGYSLLIEGLAPDSNYTHTRSFPWGWGTWKNQWDKECFKKKNIREYICLNPKKTEEFDKLCGEDASRMLFKTLDNKISSWYIRWVFDNFIKEKKSVFPYLSKVRNIGDSKNATHYSGGISAYNSEIDKDFKTNFDFNKLISLEDKDDRFLKYFSIKHKVKYRFRLLLSYNGFKKIIDEIKTKF